LSQQSGIVFRISSHLTFGDNESQAEENTEQPENISGEGLSPVL